jgi:two-component system, NarL family, invasion response regulator UvrY
VNLERDSHPRAVKVLIVEDHPIVREAYRALLENSGWVSLVVEADSAEAGYSSYQKHLPDVVMMDLNMPGAGGLNALQRITRWDPGARVVVVSMHAEESYRDVALRAGAMAYLSKRSPSNVLLETVREAARARQKPLPGGVRGEDPAQAGHGLLASLSVREFDVFRLLAQGYSVQETAALLSISPNTAGVHKTRIMNKLAVDNLAKLTLLAVRYGVIEP